MSDWEAGIKRYWLLNRHLIEYKKKKYNLQCCKLQKKNIYLQKKDATMNEKEMLEYEYEELAKMSQKVLKKLKGAIDKKDTRSLNSAYNAMVLFKKRYMLTLHKIFNLDDFVERD